MAAGGSAERKSLGGNGWAQRTQLPTPAAEGKGEEAGERRERQADVILDGTRGEQLFEIGRAHV